MRPPECSIVIATHQRAELLRATLRSLEGQTGAFEVLVVSDGEDAPTRELTRTYQPPYPIVWHFHPQNAGPATARNTGAGLARGEVLLFLDDDMEAGNGFVAAHLAAHAAAGPWKTVVCGHIVEERATAFANATDRFAAESLARYFESFQAEIGAPGSVARSAYEPALHCGAACSLPRALFHSAGGFDPRLHLRAEEMELALRLFRLGTRFRYEPRATVRHRNVKRMDEQLPVSWYRNGWADARRVKGARDYSSQTRRVRALKGRAAPAGFAYERGDVLRALARPLPALVNAMDSRLLFTLWARLLEPAEYWRGVREEGLAREHVQGLPGEPTTVLCFHSLSAPPDRSAAEFCLSPGRFRRRLQWIKTLGMGFSRLADWLEQPVPDGRPLLTFDDGYADLYRELPPAMSDLNFRPLIFVPSGSLGGRNSWDRDGALRGRALLTIPQIRDLQQQGADFGSHSVSHPWLTRLPDGELRREVGDSKRQLEDILGREVTTFAYPYGDVDERVRAAVIAAGYKLAFSVFPGRNSWTDPFLLRRAIVVDDASLAHFAFQLRTGYFLHHFVAAALGKAAEEAPTSALRALARTLFQVGRRVARPPAPAHGPRSALTEECERVH